MAWKEGSLPFWDRWNGCGTPLAANGQSQAFSPFTFLMFALPLARAYVLLGAAKLFLALCGTWLWLREMGISIRASRFGAVAFAFSFAMTPWLYHPASAEVCLWPWTFFAIELLADPSVRRRAFAALTVLLACWTLCGHLETAALGALFGILWLGLRALAGDIRGPRHVLGGACLAAGGALGLSAFLLLPQLHVIAASNRMVLARDPSHLSFVPWVPYRPGWLGGFVTSLFPRAYGDLIDSQIISGAAGSIVEMGFGYFGVVGWCCALLAFTRGPGRGPKAWVLLALVLFGLGGAMGLPIFRTAVEALPGIRLLPPLRILLFVSAAGAPLAAFGMDRLLGDHKRGARGPATLAAVCVVIAAFAAVSFRVLRGRHAAVGGLPSQKSALAWTLAVLILLAAAAALFALKAVPPPVFAGLVTGLAALELLHQGMRLYSYSPPSDLYPETPLLRFLRSQPPPYRIVGDGGALFPNTNVFALVENVGTHDPAERRDYVLFLERAAGYPPFEYFKTIRNFNSPALDFLNVKYLVAASGHQTPGPKWTLTYDGTDGRVFENRDVLPRFFAPPRIRWVPPTESSQRTSNAILAFGEPLDELLASEAFSKQAFVLSTPNIVRGFPADGLNGSARIENPAETTNRVRFAVSVAQAPTILVSSFVSDGGWSARDETGSTLPTSLANGPFLAILASPGNHTVTLTYVPPGFRAGAAVSAITGLAMTALFSSWVVQRRTVRA
jgi:hypothetical protein